MPSIAPSKSTTTTLARLPYLNSAVYFRGLSLGERYAVVDYPPRELGRRAAANEVMAGLLPLADWFRLEDRFERIGPLGLAVRGRVRSVMLFSRKPIRQLDGATIAVTEETSTSVVMLRLLLEQRYRIIPAAYVRGRRDDADALLLIGDEVLRFQRSNDQYPFEVDVAFEWWLWQHLPMVFAVWAVRKDAASEDKAQVERALIASLGMNQRRLELIAQESSPAFGVAAEDLHRYLARFIYRLGPMEEAAIARFRSLVDEHRLL